MDGAVGRIGRMITVPVSNGIASWLVPLRAARTRPPLFFACAGGGDPSDYRDLPLALPDDQPVYTFGVPPPAEGAAFKTVVQLATTYADEVRKLQPHGPYCPSGHSLGGGLVVYEMAALLAGLGEGLVALLDTLHPGYKRHMLRRDRLMFQARYLGDRLVKYARDLGRGRPDRALRDAAFFVAVRANRLYWAIVRMVFRGIGRSPRTVISSDSLVLVAAWHGCEPWDHDVPLVLFNAVDSRPKFRQVPTLGWQTCVGRSVEVHPVSGDHCSLPHPPHVQSLAEKFLGTSLGSDQTTATNAA
jgi:thioesterase domain-containing protein